MDHEATTRRAWELLSAGDLDGFGDLLADDFVEHEVMPGLEPSKQGVIQMFRMYRAAFPDMKMTPDDVLVCGDKVVIRGRATGTHKGEGPMGMPPTGRSIEVNLIDIMQFNDAGLISEHWGVFDAMAMMQQLGAIPEASPA